ncbi:MAG TPA: hypothetical protein VFV08_02135 [Puia sp.]|nr:hypothetical protein [Puia sp.]
MRPVIPRWTYYSIILGSVIFLIALAVSAFFVPQLRILHLLQALIYVAIIILARRNSPWGLGIGVIISLFWNCLNLFVTHLFQAGAGQLASALHGRHITRPDTMMVFIGGMGHFILIFSCIAAFVKLKPARKQWLQFFVGGFLAVVYLIVIVMLVAPS